jgi:tRNA(Ile2) C34 agmatinyltransferase TiaS
LYLPHVFVVCLIELGIVKNQCLLTALDRPSKLVGDSYRIGTWRRQLLIASRDRSGLPTFTHTTVVALPASHTPQPYLFTISKLVVKMVYAYQSRFTEEIAERSQIFL